MKLFKRKARNKEDILKIFEDMDRDLFVADIKIQSDIERQIKYWKHLKQVRNEVTEIKKELKDEIIKSEISSTGCIAKKRKSKKR